MIRSYPSLGKTVFVSVLATLSFVNFSQNSFAQEPAARPVARLLSSNTGAAGSRPRRAADANKATVLNNSATKTNSPSLDEADAIERRAFELTNEFRVKNGLNWLDWDPELCRLARIHSEKMASRGFFSHETPEGQRLRDRAHAIGIARFRVIAENIAYNLGYDDPGAFAVERWTKSPGHRGNMLYIGFESAAVGVHVAADGTVYFTQAFIAR